LLEKDVDAMSPLEMWVVYLKYANDPAQKETVQKIIKSREAIQMVDTSLRQISQNEQQRQAYIDRIIARNDEVHNMLFAKKEGMKESDDHWKPIVAEKDQKIADLTAAMAAEKANMEAEKANMEAEIAELKAKLAEQKGQV